MDPFEWADRMRRSTDQIAPQARRAVNRTGQGFAGMAAADAPYKTGHLSGSINAQDTTTDPTRPESTAGTNVEYAAIHEYGSAATDRNGRPQNIAPKGYFRNNLRKGLKLLMDELGKIRL